MVVITKVTGITTDGNGNPPGNWTEGVGLEVVVGNANVTGIIARGTGIGIEIGITIVVERDDRAAVVDGKESQKIESSGIATDRTEMKVLIGMNGIPVIIKNRKRRRGSNVVSTLTCCHVDSERSSNGAVIGASGSEIIGYKSQPPNNTIMIRGLAQHITENDVSKFRYLRTEGSLKRPPKKFQLKLISFLS